MVRLLKMYVLTATVCAVAAATASAGVAPIGAQNLTATTSAVGGVSCTTTAMTATFASPAGPAPVVISTDMSPVFSGCVRGGSLAATVGCTRTGTLTVTGATVGGVTPLTWRAISCTISINSVPGCRASLSGDSGANWGNAASTMSLVTNTQTLAVAGSTCTTLLPNGATTLTTGAGAALVFSSTQRTTINY